MKLSELLSRLDEVAHELGISQQMRAGEMLDGILEEISSGGLLIDFPLKLETVPDGLLVEISKGGQE